MPPRAPRTVLSLEAVVLADRAIAGMPPQLDFALRRGEVGIIHADEEGDSSSMVELCVGLIVPVSGHVRFLDVDWATRTRPQRLHRRRRIGLVVQTGVWPSQMSIMDSILMAQLYHSGRSRDELLAEATGLARLFGLPGLPADRRDETRRQVLLRAGCVRGFLGSPDLVLVHDQLLDRMPEIAVPMAQAITSTRERGGAVLWINAGKTSEAAQYVEADHIYHFGDGRLARMRRLR
jgi:phospholipid/cholesterol/gamma-HCH transport system ATP-binding protein